MRFINRNFKNSILLSLLLSLLFFTGCSQKSGDVDYSFYKDTKNSVYSSSISLSVIEENGFNDIGLFLSNSIYCPSKD